nr:phage holin family protein [Desulfobulbaceae bacterium]
MNDKNTNKDTSTSRQSIAEFVGQLVDNVSALARDEIKLVIQEIREKIRTIRCGVMTIAAGAAIAFAAFLSLCAALIIGLTSYMTLVMATLTTGTALALTATVIVFFGYRQLKR